MSFKCKLCISHHRMKQVLNKFRTKWCLSSYFSLPVKLLLIQSGIFAPIRAPPGRFNNIVVGLYFFANLSVERFDLLQVVSFRYYAITTQALIVNNFSRVPSGSLDNTIRVWNFRRGTQVTMFDTHYPVIDLVLTDTGERIAVRLAENNYLPILCLHNTPSKTRTAVTISIETASTSTTKTHARTVDSGLEISGTLMTRRFFTRQTSGSLVPLN